MANVFLTQTSVALSNSTVLVLGRNDLRSYLCIQNVGTGDLQFGFTSTLAAGSGTTLSPGGLGKQGGFFTWGADGAGSIPANPIYAISSAGTTIVILEG